MHFDDLYHKHTVYSQGEELFGLPKTEEPELLRAKKELNLLQKLYGLYSSVMTIINGYNELSWSEVDCEKINAELIELQNRCAQNKLYRERVSFVGSPPPPPQKKKKKKKEKKRRGKEKKKKFLVSLDFKLLCFIQLQTY